MRTRTSALLLAVATPALAVDAQNPTGAGSQIHPPQIVVSAVGEARVAPDRAIVSIGVESRATAVAVAASANARKQQGIIDTLVALGIRRGQISTVNYMVHPDMRRSMQTGRATVLGYVVSNVVRVEVWRLEELGRAIDAAISKGANMVHGLSFYPSNSDQPRREAFVRAIERARLDAETMARAAGGSLGALLEVSTSNLGGPIPVTDERGGEETLALARTPIEAGQETIRVVVHARWQFMPTS
ncbi:MAG: SIMPL domain-containing protein [Gemmatimonadota bacterium]|nr:SIMPL domain-containing protein [Gemmatimonadota bacterium]